MSQLDDLRKIIVGENARQLAKLQNRIENIETRTRDVLEVLPPAIDAGIKQDDRLINALRAPVSESMKQAIRAEPVEYADILYPVMGPAIRRMISNAISSLLATINQTMESATSVSGLRTRFESFRTGVPYAQLALRESLQYRVEHVYLIDRNSGLMIVETAHMDSESLDSDAVSAMFSAIQSFVQDSFSNNPEDRLTNFKVGEYNVWITHGPRAMLACVIYGDAPESLKSQLYDNLDLIRTRYSQQLADFNGDTTPFYGVEEELAPLLQVRMKDGADSPSNNKRSFSSYIFPALAIAALIGLAVVFITKSARLDTVEQYLSATPGMVIMDAFWEDGNIVVEGMQDPVADIPYAILEEHGVDRNILQLRTKPFQSLEPVIELERFRQLLLPPSSVLISIDNDTVNLAGQASLNWLLQHDLQIRQWHIDGRLNATQLMISPESLRGFLNSLGNSERTQLNVDVERLLQTSWLEIPFHYFRTHAD